MTGSEPKTEIESYIEIRKQFYTTLQAHRDDLLKTAADREAAWSSGRGDLMHRANLEIIRRLRAAADLLVDSPFPVDEPV